MKKARFRPRKKIVKRKPSLSSRSHPWLGPYVGFMHILFNLKREQMRWSKPREPGLPLWHDNTSRVYFTRYGDVCQKWGVFEKTETEELLFESWFRVTELARRVAAGERDAAQSLAMLTDHAVRELEDLATYFPELLKPIARMRPLWPAFISPHPEFKNRNRELLGTLEVGRDTKANVHPNARWRTNNPATKYTIRLIEYVIAMQGQMRELRMLRSLQKKDPRLVVEIPKYPAGSSSVTSFRRSIGETSTNGGLLRSRHSWRESRIPNVNLGCDGLRSRQAQGRFFTTPKSEASS